MDFLTLIFLGLTLTLSLLCGSYLIWPKIEYGWLAKVCRFLVLSLPFERIPSLDSPLGTIRISQILVLVGFWFLAILLLKRDQTLLQKKFNQYNFLWIIFIIVSIPSWFMVTDLKRFISTSIATLLTFGAFFLLSNFTEKVLDLIRELTVVMIFVCLFALYQFLGDMVGLPVWLTGLRLHYTKIVFGIPRVHGTALEPLYFAGMFYLPIFTCLTFILARKHVLTKRFTYSNFFLLSLFMLILGLTLSKGAFLALAPSLGIFLILAIKKFKVIELLKSIGWLGLAVGVGLLVGLLYSERVFSFFTGFFIHIWGTLTFQAATSFERLELFKGASKLLIPAILTGIGSGQFGPKSNGLIPIATDSPESLIVNNVYLEVWLEFGLLPAIIFITALFLPIIQNLKNLWETKQIIQEDNLASLILVFSLISYSIQWLLFSPIFIMPIFIIMGLLSRLTVSLKPAKLDK